MKKTLLFTCLVFGSCLAICQTDATQILYRQYGTQQYMKSLIANHPGIQDVMAAIELQTVDFVKNGTPGAVTLPMVFHLLGPVSASITIEDVQAQLKALNRDFNQPQFTIDENTSQAWEAEQFSERAGIPSIEFCLAKQTPIGIPTTGIVYVPTLTSVFPVADVISTIEGGGSVAWNTQGYINVWVAPLENGIAGFAQLPGGPAASDGIVINTAFFARAGQQGQATTNTEYSNFSLGRTLVHLIGSYLNLQELWNETVPCGDDQVEDTPIHNAPNFGKPVYRHVSTCGDYPVEMTMNLMDNTDDDVQFMFTKGQMMRMYATLAVGEGPRAGLRLLGTQCSDGWHFGSKTSERSTEGTEKIGEDLKVTVYPNPASDDITIRISTSCNSEINLKAFNQLGIIIHNQTVENVTTDKVSYIQMDTQAWPSGMYVIHVQCGGKTDSAKITLER